MMSVAEFESVRRSAAMAPLLREQCLLLVEEHAQLLRERAQIARALGELPTSWAAVRAALNDPQRLVVLPKSAGQHPSSRR